MSRGLILGFATSRNQIPFTYDSADGNVGVKSILTVDGSSMPQEGEARWASNAGAFKAVFSYGAVIDPSMSVRQKPHHNV